jgi:integrase
MWQQIDMEKGEWAYTATKTGTPHIVPLSRQALAILEDLHPLTGHHEYVFAGQKPGKPISDGTINKALRNLGYDTKEQMTGHGFRAMASTILEEVLRYPKAAIELQLAHAVPDANGRAYNRTTFLEERKTMMQAWADYLDGLKAGCKVIPMRPAA